MQEFHPQRGFLRLMSKKNRKPYHLPHLSERLDMFDLFICCYISDKMTNVRCIKLLQ